MLRRRLFCSGMGRRTILCWRLALLIPLGLFALAAIGAQSGAAAWLVLPAIGRAIGGEASADSVRLDARGRLVMRGVMVRIPGVEGDPGEVITIDRAEAEVAWSRAFSGVSAIRSLSLRGPTLRVSVERDTGMPNLAALRLPEMSGATGTVSLPRIEVAEGSILWGEHTGDRFSLLRRINVRGWIEPDPVAADRAYTVLLEEVNGGTGAATGLVVSGRIDESSADVSMAGFTFQHWLPGAVPAGARGFFEDMAIEGTIPRISVRFDTQGRRPIEAEAQLDGVRLTLPQIAVRGSGKGLTLRDTSGTISIRDGVFRAGVIGVAAEVPYRVNLGYGIFSDDGAFDAQIEIVDFQLARNPDFVPFLPEEVGTILRKFAAEGGPGSGDAVSPSAVVSSAVNLRGRYAIGGSRPPDLLGFDGTLSFRDGVSAFHGFPYPFADMTGWVEFTGDEIVIREIRGVSPTGATLVAVGNIAPLGETSEIDLKISVVDVPVDRLLEHSMPEDRRPIIRELFNRELYDAMIERGLVLSSEGAAELRRLRKQVALPEAGLDPAALRGTLAGLDRMLEAPVFDRGGVAQLDIRLHRPLGLNTRWETRVGIELAEAGLVVRNFPMPIAAHGVKIEVGGDRAVLERGSYRPIGAAAGSVTGSADLAGGRFTPMLRVRAESMRVDDLFRFAVAPPGDDDPAAEGRAVAAGIIDRLAIDGVFDAEGVITTTPDGGPGFDLALDLSRLTLTPEPIAGVPPVILTQPEGTLRLTHHGLELGGVCRALGVSDDASLENPSLVAIDLEMGWNDGEVAYDARADISGAHAALPGEQVVGVFSPDAASKLRGLRDQFAPTGRADIAAHLSKAPGQEPRSRTEVTGLRDAEVAWLGGRLGLDNARGMAAVVVEGDLPHAEVAGLEADLLFDGEPAGRIGVAGTMNLEAARGDAQRRLEVSVAGGRFESSMAKRFVRDVIRGGFAHEYHEHEARGEFDLDLVLLPLSRPPDAGTPLGIEQLARPESVLRPRWAAFTRRGAELRFDEIDGAVVTAPGSARFEGLVARNGEMEFRLDGAVVADGAGGSSLLARIGGRASSLSDALRAALPAELNDQIDALGFRAGGEITLDDATLRVRTLPPADGAPIGVTPRATMVFEGRVGLGDASLVVGVPIDKVRGSGEVSVGRGPDDPAASFSLRAIAERARVNGLWFEDARVAVESDASAPGRVVMPLLSARSAGGVVTGHAAAYPDVASAGDEVLYTMDFRFSGLSLASVLDHADAFRLGLDDPAALPKPRADTGATLEGVVTLGGVVGRDQTRRGKGSVRIAGGEVVRTPGVTRLLELANLQLPGDERLDYASVEFSADGEVFVLEDIALVSRSLEVLGFGTVSWPGKQISLRFRPRGVTRIPLLSFVVDSVRNEVLTTVDVGGTLDDPAWSIKPFSGTRRLIGALVGADGSATTRTLAELEQRADSRRLDRSALRRAIPPIRPAKMTSRERLSAAAGQEAP
jgi:hypothetical protein